MTGAAVIVALSVATPGRGQSPPHWASTSLDIDCTSQCHVTHQASGWLTQAASNAALCQSCHSATGMAADLPVDDVDMAVPGVQGTTHAYGVAALHATLSTRLPADPAMQLRVVDGDIVCSTCHDQHRARAAYRGTPRVGAAKQTTALGSTGTVASGGTYTGADGAWYLVEIAQAGSQDTALFRYSKDGGASWFPLLTAGPDVALDSGVEVGFAVGSYALGERWELSAAWPFLRAPLDLGDSVSGDAFCRDCHADWAMAHGDVEVWDGGYKSHPVGVPLGANGRGYDRSVPLDGNGVLQGDPGADANPTNDLALDSGGNVQCLTCHGVHYADSNTLTVDTP